MKKPGVFDEAIEFLKYDAVDAERCSCPKEYGHRQKARELRAAIRVLRAAGNVGIEIGYSDGKPNAEAWVIDIGAHLARAILAARRVAEKGGKK
jgi:hypothetical protein